MSFGSWARLMPQVPLVASRSVINMKTKSALSVAVLLSIALLAVASPKLLLSWKNPGFSGGTFHNVLVLGLNGKAVNRAEFEDQLTAAISRPGTTVFPSYEFLARPDATPIDMKDFRELVSEQKFDGIVVARLVKKETKTTYVPGTLYNPYPYYNTFYGYYSTVYPLVYSPGYLQTEKVAQVEVNFYATTPPDGQLVWTGTTNTFDAHAAMKNIKDVVKIVSKELEKQNIIAASGK
jgi:hypothetical protein